MNENVSVKGIKWDDIVYKFEWTFEADRCEDYLRSKENVNSSDIDVISNARVEHAEKFDLEAVKEY